MGSKRYVQLANRKGRNGVWEQKNLAILFTVVAVAAILLSACIAPVESTLALSDAPAGEAGVIEPGTEEMTGVEPWTTPHAMRGDIRVRQAIAHCIDRDQLIAAVYTYVSDEIKPTLRMDSFLPKNHWAYGGPYQDYPYDPDIGAALLEVSGWTLAEGSAVRANGNGDMLALSLTTTDAQFRQTWAAVAEQNLEGCGFDITRNHVTADIFFGDTTGLAHRE